MLGDLPTTLKFAKRRTSYLLIILLFTGCAHPRVIPIKPKPAILIKETKRIFDQIDKNVTKISGLEGVAKVEMFRRNNKIVGKQEITIQSPIFLYVETLNPFGSMVSLLVANEQTLDFYDSSTNQLYSGRPVAENLSKLFPLFLDVNEVVNIALYRAKIPKCESRSVYLEPSDNSYKIICVTKSVRQEFWVDSTNYNLLKQELYRNDHLELKIAYRNFKQFKGGLFPYDVVIDFPPKESAIAYKWQEIDFNPSIPENKFKMPKFENVERVDLANFR